LKTTVRYVFYVLYEKLLGLFSFIGSAISGSFLLIFDFSHLSLFAEDVWTADVPLAGEQADGWRLQAGPHHPQQEEEVRRGRS
jgi:hypothetical protein